MISVVMLIALILPLAAHAYIGTFSRMTSDDYCRASLFKQKGIFGGVVDQYNNWTGSFTSILLSLTAISFGQSAIPFQTALILVIWLIVLALTIRQVLMLFTNSRSWLGSFILAAAVLFATLAIAPNMTNLYTG